jgi:hypothetical protein
MEIDELKLALNWEGIYQGADCPVIMFTERDAGLIQGLRYNNDTYYIDYPDVMYQPISFLIERGPETFQYWVLGDKLHRLNGPAMISTNSESKTSHITHYENGLKHNDTGPAEIIIRGQSISTIHPKTLVDMAPDYMVEEWNEFEMYWFDRGVQSLYPAPHSMICSNGYRIFNTSNRVPVQEDFLDEPTFSAANLVANWTRENSKLDDDEFRIRSMRIMEYYQSIIGDKTKHGCKVIAHLGWVVDGEPVVSSPDACERIRTDLFENWNIWEKPFFQDDQELMFTIQEALT